MTKVTLSFTFPFHMNRLWTLRCLIDHLLTLVGVSDWRWELESPDGTHDIIRGPFNRQAPEDVGAEAPVQINHRRGDPALMLGATLDDFHQRSLDKPSNVVPMGRPSLFRRYDPKG